MTTGEKLQVLRKKKGYTQEDLAGILGVSRQAVSKWESDSAFPETEKLIELSKIYDCSIDYLLKEGQEGDKNIPTEEKICCTNVWEKARQYMKKNNFFTACFICVYIIIGFLLFLLPVILFQGVIDYMGYVEIRANVYDLISTSNYQVGNYLYLGIFLLHLSAFGLGIAYGFYPKRKVHMAIRIVLAVKLLLMILFMVLFISAIQFGFILSLLYDIVAVILFFLLPKNKFVN